MRPILVEGCYAAPIEGDPRSFDVVPGPPEPERDSSGRPAVVFLPPGAGGVLQLGVRWPIPEEALRRALGTAARLRPAVEEVISVEVHAAIGDERRRLASVASAGYSPWTALFSVRLDEVTGGAALAALTGHPGRMWVTYEATLRPGLPLEVRITGRGSGPGTGDTRARVSEALAEGRLRVEWIAPPGLDEAVLGPLTGEVTALAAEAVQRQEVLIDVTATGTATGPTRITATTDISAWFEDVSDRPLAMQRIDASHEG